MQEKVKKAARGSRNYARANALVKHYKTIPQLEAERKKRDEFITGSNCAAALLCAMFAVLAVGAVMLGW